MSLLEVNKITPQSGTTLTLGDSGDTINFGSSDMTITNDISVNTSTSSVPVYSAEKPAFANSLTSLSSDRVKFGTTSLRTGVNRAANHEAFTSNSYLNVFDNNEVTDYMEDDANNDFTIELWFYDNTVLGSDPEASSLGNIIDCPSQFSIYHSHDYSSPPVVGFSAGSGTTTTTTNTSSDEWHHAAIVNQSGTKTFYLDGSFVGSQTSSWGPTASNIRLGNRPDNRRRFNGFIDEFRISSTARYTSSFTPPTEAFTKDGDTLILMHFEGDDGSQNQFLVESVNDTTTSSGVFVDGSASRLGVNNLTPTEAIDVVGTIKATTFSGSGASLTDLYLSGSVYLGGTGSANALDDYEEGTWTPTFGGAGSDPSSFSWNVQSGTYTKVGNQVFARAIVYPSSFSGGSGNWNVRSLPFTANANSVGTMWWDRIRIQAGQAPGLVPRVLGSTTYMEFPEMNDDSGEASTRVQVDDLAGNFYLELSIVYTTDS
jgi:hypothetical protein